MIAEHRVVTPLRIFLVLLFGILLVFQTLALPGIAVLGLLMVVMRALLRQATTLRTDMESVI